MNIKRLMRDIPGTLIAAVAAAALFAAAPALAAETEFQTPYCKYYSKKGSLGECVENEKKAKRNLETRAIATRVREYCTKVAGGEGYSYIVMERCISSLESPKPKKPDLKGKEIVPVEVEREKAREAKEKAAEKDREKVLQKGKKKGSFGGPPAGNAKGTSNKRPKR